ncbi:MAG: ABC transporter permease [Gemmataceae bacterium]
MRLRTLVCRELWQRKSQLLTSFLAIFLGITALVAIRTICAFSEKSVQAELDALGANILILPKAVSIENYHAADLHGQVIPEDYVYRITMSGVRGVKNLSPKLCVPVSLAEKQFMLTGILPRSEFQAKSAWRGAGIFAGSSHCCCGGIGDVAGLDDAEDAGKPIRQRAIATLGRKEVLVGAEVAADIGIQPGQRLELLGEPFEVSAVLPPTGTVDDSRIFAHLHTVQQLADKGETVNAIEVMCCCQHNAEKVVDEINQLLPEAKVVTIRQVVDTQVKINRLMSQLSLIFLGIIALVGGASIANYMYANVRERRREIGTLMALGAAPGFVLRLFLLKALLLGLVGGLLGYGAGTVAAMQLGPRLAGVPVLPLPLMALWAVGISLLITLLSSWLPARRAARVDPCTTLQEV